MTYFLNSRKATASSQTSCKYWRCIWKHRLQMFNYHHHFWKLLTRKRWVGVCHWRSWCENDRLSDGCLDH